ncbi:LysR family transcriptional regulator [Vibrio sp. SS-MA-C1-2]|uniref:LysR family transcriptional regulator n=1 Tax=Vibrio sp. SS-MA-C1-2 TaxID=2908646 RepID=UPI001F3B2825|nr:LysR family transcriptional regulator [Vibrio sp. SS-MA-C1-2]UJF18370.1 LysR family transcriptional regulator [Vibrio sp. SS-MA-C1-2]
MGELEYMRLFITIVESGSITKAAEQLDMAKSVVSKRLSELEENLKCKLINRTTRTSSLTDAGEFYLQRAHQILSDVTQLNEAVVLEQTSVKGILRISAPLVFGLEHLAPAFDLFYKKYPDIQLDIDFSDTKIDLVKEGYDLAFRIGILEDSSLRFKRIAPVSFKICATKKYLDQHGYPETIEEFKQHHLVKYSLVKRAGYTVHDKDDREYTLKGKINIYANNGTFLKMMVLNHHGISAFPTFNVWQEIKDKKLIEIMPNYKIKRTHAYIVYPNSRYLPHKNRVFIDFIQQYFSGTPYWES